MELRCSCSSSISPEELFPGPRILLGLPHRGLQPWAMSKSILEPWNVSAWLGGPHDRSQTCPQIVLTIIILNSNPFAEYRTSEKRITRIQPSEGHLQEKAFNPEHPPKYFFSDVSFLEFHDRQSELGRGDGGGRRYQLPSIRAQYSRRPTAMTGHNTPPLVGGIARAIAFEANTAHPVLLSLPTSNNQHHQWNFRRYRNRTFYSLLETRLQYIEKSRSIFIQFNLEGANSMAPSESLSISSSCSYHLGFHSDDATGAQSSTNILPKLTPTTAVVAVKGPLDLGSSNHQSTGTSFTTRDMETSALFRLKLLCNSDAAGQVSKSPASCCDCDERNTNCSSNYILATLDFSLKQGEVGICQSHLELKSTCGPSESPVRFRRYSLNTAEALRCINTRWRIAANLT